MSHFQKKLNQVKQAIRQKELNSAMNGCSGQNMQNLSPNFTNSQSNQCHASNCHSGIQLKIPKQEKQQMCIQQPIIIQKKSNVSKTEANGFTNKNKTFSSSVANLNHSSATKRIASQKLVQPFVPVNIPIREKKNYELDTAVTSIGNERSNGNKQILIHIDQDQNKNKQCLKKLFKKVHKLTEELTGSERERMRLELELENYKKISKASNDHDKIINKLEGQNYKLSVELDMIKKQIADKDREVEVLRIEVNRKPKEIIKEIIVEKPVEIQVEVPRMIPGPERIVEKIIQVPKYIEVEKTVTIEVPKQVPRDVTRTIQVQKIIEKPVYIEKPIYIDRPVHIEKRVEVPVEVPIQVPLYVNRPVVEQESLYRIKHLQNQIQALLQENSRLQAESYELRNTIQKLDNNLNILRQHNQQKNREVQILLHNSMDYQPISPSGGQRSFVSAKYTVSSNPHRRII